MTTDSTVKSGLSLNGVEPQVSPKSIEWEHVPYSWERDDEWEETSSRWYLDESAEQAVVETQASFAMLRLRSRASKPGAALTREMVARVLTPDELVNTFAVKHGSKRELDLATEPYYREIMRLLDRLPSDGSLELSRSQLALFDDVIR